MLALAILLTLAAPDVSRNGRFRVEVVERQGEGTVVVRSTGPGQPVVARLRLRARNVAARFVAADNLLVSWSCGSPCEAAALFTPQGKQLATLSFPVLSADDRFGLDLEVLDLKTGDVVVSIVDLHNGQRAPGKPVSSGLFHCTEVSASATEALFAGCDGSAATHVPFAGAR